jgi:hypothetical protein
MYKTFKVSVYFLVVHQDYTASFDPAKRCEQLPDAKMNRVSTGASRA